MGKDEFKEALVTFAETIGMIKEQEKANAVIRTNLTEKGDDNVRFTAFIRAGEEPSGRYSDLSLVFFPGKEDKKWLMAIVTGTNGFNLDHDLASTPGLRRNFLRLLPQNNSFYKPHFEDLETPLDMSQFEEQLGVNQNHFDKYKKFLAIGCIIDVENLTQEDWANSRNAALVVKAWIAQYARIRGWATNETQFKLRNKALDAYKNAFPSTLSPEQDKANVKALLGKKKFVVLQGAPGTGKTFLAEKIAEEGNYKTFFTQFHAETSYSDFVYGILPQLDEGQVGFKEHEGILLEAIQYAKDNPNEKILLIIDEINRANLANVLGPVFYFFEADRKESRPITIGSKEYDGVPGNFYVIATMNTADRSLAVVDFALRRRFAWYTIQPHFFEGCEEAKNLFNEIATIFDTYADDSELNLQPGGAYFNVATKEALNEKIEYELMPLIKEYLVQGMMTPASEEFSRLFYGKIKKHLFI